MNTLVSLEIKKLLFDKGWKYTLSLDETGYRVENSLAEQRWNEGDLTYINITIAEVVMWLYEKHGIWIHAMMSFKEFTPYIQCDWNYKKESIEGVLEFMKKRFNSPTEAYEAAIDYTLNNLI